MYIDYVKNENIIMEIMDKEKCSREAAIQFEYQKNYKNQSRQLSNESSYISNLLLRNLDMRNLPSCQINLCCRFESVRTGIRWFERIVEVDVPINSEYFHLEKEMKAMYLINLFSIGLKKLCAETGWEYKLFESAIQSVVNANFICEYYLNNEITRKGITAKIFCKHTMDSMTVFVVFFDKLEQINKAHLLTSKPNIMDYERYLGEFTWIDDSSVCLYSKNRVEKFIAYI